MLFRPNPSSGVPIYLQLMEQVKHSIETGALRPGDQLPGIRPLAEQLVINPNTVAKAYRELEHEGVDRVAPWRGGLRFRAGARQESDREAPGRPGGGGRGRGSAAKERCDRRGDPAVVRGGTDRAGEGRSQ